MRSQTRRSESKDVIFIVVNFGSMVLKALLRFVCAEILFGTIVSVFPPKISRCTAGRVRAKALTELTSRGREANPSGLWSEHT